MNLFFKLLFLIKKPKVVVVFDQGLLINPLLFNIFENEYGISKTSLESTSILGLFRNYPLIVKWDGKKTKIISFLVRHSSFPILLLNNIPENNNDFYSLIKSIPRNGYLITDLDSLKNLKRVGELGDINFISTGFDEKSEVWASDINIGTETNFKLRYGGDAIPFWFDRELAEEEIMATLLAVGSAMVSGINLVKISQIFKG
ncbi:MAG: hypothetical protein KY054_00555 [Candidatus Nealsonbacteria bacterium]|nr:hypothetical protein [Candidatus Nealsonbacteria bacterium]